MNTGYKLLIALIVWVMICAGFVAYEFYKNTIIIRQDNPVQKEAIICPEDSFSVKDFVLELHIQEVKYPDIVLRQACLESTWFTSPVWKKRHNPFGFCYKGEYITFNDWKSAISYMKDWQDKYYKGGEYYRFIERIGYAQDCCYVETLKKMDMNNLKTCGR